MGLEVVVVGDHPALRMAAEELRDYVGRLSPTGEEMYELTVLDQPENGVAPHPEDDAILIDCGPAGGRIAGANPRSVLFAVYRYLHELGVRWLSPGPGNDLLPVITPAFPAVNLAEAASYRYRTICIEGACSLEHARDLIDWATKHAMNGYFIQFDNAACFWRRWYLHEKNPEWTDQPPQFGPEDARRLMDELLPEIQRRGLRFERVGHGWTSRALGLDSEGWDTLAATELTRDQQVMLARINGKHQLHGGIPLNTNLCYSSLTVRERIVQEVVHYAGAHPEVDLLHLWLADGTNNHCECETCARQRPADWYVTLLNDVDDALTRAGLDTRLVFLIYVDLLWPPQHQTLRHPERFVLMFAPITRSFQETFADARPDATPPPEYTRNKLDFPTGIDLNLKLLRNWQKQFKGDSFDFDYHLTWACYQDLAQIRLARVLHHDIQCLGDIGLHGYNSCQSQRVGFPHNLPMQVMAATLWDKSRSFAAIAKAYFRDAYGQQAGPEVQAFFTSLSDWWQPLCEPVYLPHIDRQRIKEALANLKALPDAIKGMRRLYDKHHDHESMAVRHAWQGLQAFLELLELLVSAYTHYLSHSSTAPAAFEAVFQWVRQHEHELHHGFDAYRFLEVQAWRLHELENSNS